MRIEDYIAEKGKTTDGKKSVVFFSLLVISNLIETVYNSGMEELTLKQLMLLILVAVSEGETFTSYGKMMGSSRQNIKTLAGALEKKSYVFIRQAESDRRACGIFLSDKAAEHFKDTDDYYTRQIIYLFSEFNAGEIDLMFSFIPKLLKGIERMEKKYEKT